MDKNYKQHERFDKGAKSDRYGKRDDKSYGKRDDKSYGKRDDKPYGKRDDKPYGRRDDKSYGKWDDKPYGKRDDKPYGKRDDKPYGKRDDKPYYSKPDKRDGYKGANPEFDREKPYKKGVKPEFERSGKGGFEREDKRGDYRRPEVRNDFAPMYEDELPYIIMGRNAVREAIKSGRSIDKILVVGERDGSLREIVNMARDRNLIVQDTERARLDELCMPFGHGGKPGNHQGIVARVPGAEYVDVDDILEYASERGEAPFVVILDGITDPYNLGSIIRSAECAGVHGIIIPKRRSAGLTSAVVKASAGAVDHMRVARVSNIVSTMERLKQEGIWIAGADMDGKSMYESGLSGALALVIGAEGDGLAKLVKEKCDFLVSIPLRGNIDSLNASVAAGIIMFEKNRQDA